DSGSLVQARQRAELAVEAVELIGPHPVGIQDLERAGAAALGAREEHRGRGAHAEQALDAVGTHAITRARRGTQRARRGAVVVGTGRRILAHGTTLTRRVPPRTARDVRRCPNLDRGIARHPRAGGWPRASGPARGRPGGAARGPPRRGRCWPGRRARGAGTSGTRWPRPARARAAGPRGRGRGASARAGRGRSRCRYGWPRAATARRG